MWCHAQATFSADDPCHNPVEPPHCPDEGAHRAFQTPTLSDTFNPNCPTARISRSMYPRLWIRPKMTSYPTRGPNRKKYEKIPHSPTVLGGPVPTGSTSFEVSDSHTPRRHVREGFNVIRGRCSAMPQSPILRYTCFSQAVNLIEGFVQSTCLL